MVFVVVLFALAHNGRGHATEISVELCVFFPKSGKKRLLPQNICSDTTRLRQERFQKRFDGAEESSVGRASD